MKVNSPSGYDWVLFHKSFEEFTLINIRQVLKYEYFDGFKLLLVTHSIKELGHNNTNRLFKEFGPVWITKEGLVFYKENNYGKY